MPISKARNAARMRDYRAQKKASGTALMPRALVRKLHRLGVNPARYLRVGSVSLDDYRDLKKGYDAKVARVEWQSSGMRMLHERIATLEARLATQPAMEDTEIMRRLAAVEVDQALHEAEHGLEVRDGL